MNLLRHITTRPVAMSMIYLIILATGLASLIRLPLELMPGVDFPQLSVQTSWRHASPETMEAFVTAPIEEVCHTIRGVRRVSSISEEGQSTVVSEFTREADMDFAALELNEKLSIVREKLPYGTSPPRIVKYVPKEFETGNFLTYHLSGDMPLSDLRRYALTHVRGALVGIDGVTDVQVTGGAEPIVQIEIDPQKCLGLGVDVDRVSPAVKQAMIQQSLGVVHKGRLRVAVRLEQQLASIAEIGDLYLHFDERKSVRIRDVGRVMMTGSIPRRLMRINAQPAVVIDVYKEPGANSIGTADRIFRRLKRLHLEFPPGMRLIKVQDQSEDIRRELNTLVSRAGFSILVVFIVLLLFLRRLTSPLIILMTIFFAVLMTIDFFFFADMTLNILTLAGLALGFGMLVDNSVVVLDSIFRRRELGDDPAEAAQRGAAQVVLPVAASTLTTLAALLPFFIMVGDMRVYYIPFALSVSLSLFASLIVAFTFTPALSTRLLSAAGGEVAVRTPAYEKIYAGMLKWTLSHGVIVILLAVILLGGAGWLFNKYVYLGPVWQMRERTYIVVHIRLPRGADRSSVDAIAGGFEKLALADGKIENVTCEISGANARLRITFPDSLGNSAYPLVLKENMIAKAASIGNAQVGVYGYGEGFSSGGGGTAPSFRIKVLGYNYEKVKNIAIALGERLKRYARVRNVDVNSSGWWRRSDISEMALVMNRERMGRFGITPFTALSSIQRYLQENVARQTISLHGREYELRVKARGSRQFDVNALQRLVLQNNNGRPVCVADVADIVQRPVMSSIERENQQYQRLVVFEFRGPYKMGQKLVESILESTQLPPGFRLDSGRMWTWMSGEEKAQIHLVIGLALLLIFMTTAALFESWRLPFIVILSVPMGLVGVFLIYVLTGYNFDRGAYIGLVLLFGIVVNNAILLVAHIRLLHRSGRGLAEAAREGAMQRLRPILITSSTTIVGLLPLVIGADSASLWSSLALTIIGGLAGSALMIVFVVPILYILFENSKAGRTAVSPAVNS